MRTRPIYKEYLKVMEKMFVDLDNEHYIEFIPKSRIITVDGEEVYENYLEVTIVDDTIVHEIKFEATLSDLQEHIRIVQDLAKNLAKSDIINNC